MRLLPVLLICAALAGCGGGDGDDASARRDAPAPFQLTAGEERDFAPGRLASGDVVTCGIGGLAARIAVPESRRRSFTTSTVAWTKDGARASIRLDVRPTGRIVASCDG
jgi:hypothetical protein